MRLVKPILSSGRESQTLKRTYEISMMSAETCSMRTVGYTLPEHKRNGDIT
jgi:hypothetical protein